MYDLETIVPVEFEGTVHLFVGKECISCPLVEEDISLLTAEERAIA